MRFVEGDCDKLLTLQRFVRWLLDMSAYPFLCPRALAKRNRKEGLFDERRVFDKHDDESYDFSFLSFLLLLAIASYFFLSHYFSPSFSSSFRYIALTEGLPESTLKPLRSRVVDLLQNCLSMTLDSNLASSNNSLIHKMRRLECLRMLGDAYTVRGEK